MPRLNLHLLVLEALLEGDFWNRGVNTTINPNNNRKITDDFLKRVNAQSTQTSDAVIKSLKHCLQQNTSGQKQRS